MKKISILYIILQSICLQAQWNISTGNVDWTPNSSSSPNVLPDAYFNHGANIIGTFQVNIEGGGITANAYPLCNVPLTIDFSLSGGATFNGATANAVVSTNGDWESRFTWNMNAAKTLITGTQISTIPNMIGGVSNNFSLLVLAPSYSSQFTITMTLNPGAGGGACNVAAGRNPNIATDDDQEATDGFTSRSLPIQLFQLNSLSKKSAGLNVEWKTQNESNTDYFEVYRMYHGNQSAWMKVGKVEAAGVSHDEITYNFLDNSYAKAEKIYYRIKQVDQNGSFTYTDIKSIELKENGLVKLSGFPNPIQNIYHLAFNSPSDASIQIEVIDLLGKVAFKQKASAVKGYNQYDLEMKDVAAGTYFVKVSGKEIYQTLTVVKTE